MKIGFFRWELKNYGSTLKRTPEMSTTNTVLTLQEYYQKDLSSFYPFLFLCFLHLIIALVQNNLYPNFSSPLQAL